LLQASKASMLRCLKHGGGGSSSGDDDSALPWELCKSVAQTPCGEARVYSVRVEGEGAAVTKFKVVGRVPCAPQAAYESLCDFAQHRLAWDSTLSMGETVQRFGSGAAVDGGGGGGFSGVVRYRTNPTAAGLVSAREFVDLHGMEQLEGGGILSFNCAAGAAAAAAAAAAETQMATAPGHVAATNFSGTGLYVVPEPEEAQEQALGGDGGSAEEEGHIFAGMAKEAAPAAAGGGSVVVSRITMVCHTDPGGALPKWLVNRATSGALVTILTGLQRYCRERQR
jgi:hypothetical protein